MRLKRPISVSMLIAIFLFLAAGSVLAATWVDSGANTYTTGNVGIGTTAPSGKLDVVTGNSMTKVLIATYDDGVSHPTLDFFKSDTDTVGGLSQTDDGDGLGNLTFSGVNSSGTLGVGAIISVTQYGTAGTGKVPAAIKFATINNTTYGWNSNQLYLHPNGHVGVGNVTNPVRTLDINGSMRLLQPDEPTDNHYIEWVWNNSIWFLQQKDPDTSTLRDVMNVNADGTICIGGGC